MTLIKISDLTSADNESLVGADSFFNELQKAETTQIFGGWRGGGCYKKGGGDRWKKDDCGWKKEEEYDCYTYKEKSDYNYCYKEKRENKDKGGWKKDC
jgi:hypothetical protein